jgi:regulator of sigma E protease
VLYSLLIFFLFLGPLIFFHELGHFFFARLFGVRVETFSIGFGPKLFSWKKGDTTYAFSVIPLGGYVKMFGDDPLSETPLTPEEEKVAYTKKSKWARFWIVFGGPLANFVLAFALYLGLATGGEKVPEPKLGVVKQDTIFFDLGFKTGDVLKKVNDHKIFNFDDVAILDESIQSIEVLREGETETLTVNVESKSFQEGLFKAIGYLKAPVL